MPIDDFGELILEEFDRLLGPRTKLVGVVHTSNALGTRNPLEHIIREAHARGVPVLVDGAQAVAHETGGRARPSTAISSPSPATRCSGRPASECSTASWTCSTSMPPFLGGGEMIRTVTLEASTYKEPPYRFEAGTPDIAGAIGLGAAVGLPRSRSGWTASPPTTTSCSTTPLGD